VRIRLVAGYRRVEGGIDAAMDPRMTSRSPEYSRAH
jgi:hypothetical protein